MSNRNEINIAVICDILEKDKLDFTKIKLPFACDTYAPGPHPSVASPQPQSPASTPSVPNPKALPTNPKPTRSPASIAIHIVTVGWI
ncbi:hypothetical protein VNO80_06455 [Phaseolus coccineus]|uniref:Uncharacterized protein n=1 Tax=Phaseolus coccineus TaxID=3886 RepID=A0AAN9NM67_PHACN